MVRESDRWTDATSAVMRSLCRGEEGAKPKDEAHDLPFN